MICDSGLFRHPEPDVSAGRRCFGEAGIGAGPTDDVEILADGGPSALARFSVNGTEFMQWLRSSPTADRRRWADVATVVSSGE